MGKTNAEIQATYRERQAKRDNGNRVLSTWLSTSAFLALERLARHQGVSKRAYLEELILAEGKKTSGTIAFPSKEWDRWIGNGLDPQPH